MSGMSNLDKTAVIIVNFNGKKTLDHCLDSLQSQTFSHFKTIVVDNGSHDDSTEGIEERFSGVEVIRLKKNIGFAAANNLAVERAEAVGHRGLRQAMVLGRGRGCAPLRALQNFQSKF